MKRIDVGLRGAWTMMSWAPALGLALSLASCGGGGSSDAGAGTSPGGGSSSTTTSSTVVTLNTPANLSAGLTGTLAITASASDSSGISGVEVQVDGAKVGNTLAAAPYAVNVDTSQYAAGQHIVRVRATNAAGTVSAWTSATVSFGGSQTQPAGITRNEAWVTGMNLPTAFAQASDGRIFVAQQGGALRVVQNGALLSAPFVQVTVDSTEERGLLGVAVHPNFASNHYVYVYYTSTDGSPHNRISRFVASGNTADASTEQVLVNLPALSTYTDHNGGGMHFGLDGKLYVGVGDNNNGAQSQDLTLPFGKLLRFNDDGSIPGDNPFGNAIWAYGLRNPYTFAVQPGTGAIFINDVGENTWEEIDQAARGANYGWPGSEGGDNLAAGMTAPLFTYKHTAASPAGSGPGGFIVGDAIAGGAFYPSGGGFPTMYEGSYFFADFIKAFVARFDVANNAGYAFASLSDNPVDMLVGSDGALYVLTHGGGIVRFSATP